MHREIFEEIMFVYFLVEIFQVEQKGIFPDHFEKKAWRNV